jgi:Asp-tRNA(Asn)/Glu-tRNA(Gln) amidotransferase A subunit family amidase
MRLSRRAALAAITGAGLGASPLARALASELQRGPLDADAIGRAEWISGVRLSESQREVLAATVGRMQTKLEQLRQVPLDADTPPALHFRSWHDAYHGQSEQAFAASHGERRDAGALGSAGRPADNWSESPPRWPETEAEIAFAPIRVLGAMLRQRRLSSLELTKLCLRRLEQLGPRLHCVVTLTGELAIEQALAADRQLAAGHDRGPLHGIPWGAKDLIAVPGYPTTWGAAPFREQRIDQLATVAERLQQAGAVLVAKLSLGAIAMGDRWFGGVTRNPWNLRQGSSGSSAGSAAAVVAGLVPFALGSETYGSIISPSKRCGATGLRPTFGRVSRDGCMPLAWSFDKIGPLARSVDDCGLVLASIHGADGRDPTAVTRPFTWPIELPLKSLRVGYTGRRADRSELDLLQQLGARLVPVQLPSDLPIEPLTMMLEVESASMFYDLWKEGEREDLNRWPQIWQTAGFVSAIDYVRAARVRTLVMQRMEALMSDIDFLVSDDDLLLTNLTGHPMVVLPWRSEPVDTAQDATSISSDRPSESGSVDRPQSEASGPTQPQAPGAVTITGRLYDESRLLAIADALQKATGHHRIFPPEFYQAR